MTDPHKPLAIVEHHDQPEVVHPLVAMAMQSGSLDPATLRELMALERDWQAGQAKRAFTRALVAMKADANWPTVIDRDTVVDFKNRAGVRTYYKHTSLAAAMDAVVPLLTAYGFALAWSPRTEAKQVHVTCRLTHSEGHSEEATISAPIDESGSKSPAQGVASTITLLQRYSALSLLGIATADMKDPTPMDADAINTARTLKALAALERFGKTREQAEAFLERAPDEWTNGDLDRLLEWVKGARNFNV